MLYTTTHFIHIVYQHNSATKWDYAFIWKTNGFICFRKGQILKGAWWCIGEFVKLLQVAKNEISNVSL